MHYENYCFSCQASKNPGQAQACYMAAFAISEGFADMTIWDMKGAGKSGEAIKAAWMKGLKALGKMEGPAETAHQTCDPNPLVPKATLADLVAVGDCISSACDAESTTESP